MPLNCGLESLSKIADLKNVSAFTLIHLGRDNGLNLFFFKVNDLKDLPRVQRPAIFHQNDHFVYVKNGEPMPDGEYTGHVIGPAVLGRVLSMAEAKTVNGGKNFLTGKNSDGEQTGHGAIIDILAVVGSIVTANPLTGAVIEAGGSAIERAQNKDELGSPYNPLAIATDAVKGYAIGSGASGAAQGVSAGGGLSNGIGQAFTNAVKGGIQGETQGFSHPISTSLHGLSIDTSGIAGSVASNTAAFNAATGGSAAAPSSAGINAGANAVNAFNASAPAMSLATGGVANAAGAPLANVGNFTPSNYAPNSNFSISNLPSTASNVIGSSTGAAKAAGGGILDTIGKAAASNPIGALSTAAGAIGVFGSKAPEYSGATPSANYSAVSQFLGPNALTQPTNDQLSSYITTPIEDLAKTFSSNSTRVSDTINTAYDNQKQQLVHQYAQAGQNLATSSELQDKVSQLEQKRSTDLSNAALETQNAGIGQAIQIKQQALSQGLQSGQFNQTLAMQLAQLTGDQQNLQYAIANNDYQGFQQIMGKLMTLGIPQTVSVAK